MLRFRMLGTLEIEGRRKVVGPATPKIGGVLALLLFRPNEIVDTSVIIEELWGDAVPKTASATTHTYVYRLRRLLQQLDPVAAEDEILTTSAPGYILRVSTCQVDAFRFSELAAEGRRLFDEGETKQAASIVNEAVNLWRGPALTNITCGQVVQAHVAELHESYIASRQLLIQAMFKLGRHQEILSDLKMLAAKHTLNEWIHGRLIQALLWCGRRADALTVYRRLAHRLAEELGIDPSPDLKLLAAQANGSLPLLGLPEAPVGPGRQVPSTIPRSAGG